VFSFAWWLSFVIGFLSLSVEIVWVRAIGFSFRSLPPAFSFVLGCFLVGIALGAVLGKRLCERSQNLYVAATIVLSASALVDVLTPLFISHVMTKTGEQLLPPAAAIIATAALKSTLFPIVHHLGSVATGPRVGRSVSRIYFGNIMGATLGPLVTGFVAFDYLSIDECFAIAAAIAVLAATACILVSGRPKLIAMPFAAAVVASVIAFNSIGPGPGSLGLLVVGGPMPMTHYIANSHGIIHTSLTSHGEAVFGGNIYDGIATVNVDTNPNGLDRLFMLATVHPRLERVLFIGLSAGSWVRIMQGFPEVESIDVVEINPGYLELARQYWQLSAFLKDPRVHIHIDDGRRWMRRNPTLRFDAIIQNTTYHWRANVGNMLSREYFQECQQHLNANGILIGNSTGSFDVFTTAQSVFSNTYRYANFFYAADHPLEMNREGLWRVHRPDRKLFSAADPKPGSVVERLMDGRLEPTGEFLGRLKATGEVITDDNLLSEYRHGLRFGPGFLRSLLPPVQPEFKYDD
jgi:spermidine synthase